MTSKENTFPAKQACYFLTFNTVDWVDIFIRPVYKQIIVHSLNHFIAQKGLNVYAWCLMTNHLHLLAQAKENCVIAGIEKEFKSFTTKKILQDIGTEPEARKIWMIERFENFSNVLGFLKKFHIWQTCSNPVFIDLHEKEILLGYVEYIHANPTRDRVVDSAPDYLYSSARDYAGMEGLVHITKLPDIDQQIVTADTTSNFFGKFIRN
jgi:REP element-mobilizing transposase RayT